MVLIESISYSDEKDINKIFEDSIFRYCDFKGLELEGDCIDSVFLSCKFNELDLYWVLFNSVLCVDTVIENSVFAGVSFRDCRFLNCKFINCRFEKDNLGSPCIFDETQFIDTKFIGCSGHPIEASK